MDNEWRIIKHENEDVLAENIARILEENLVSESRPTWCLASGRTPELSYKKLVRNALSNSLNVDNLAIFSLDEWMGLEPKHQSTCDSFFRRLIVDPLNIGSDAYFFFDSSGDEESEVQKIKQNLKAKPCFSLCILGLGLNGHIGFNEPAESLAPSVHRCKLSETSIAHEMVNSLDKKPIYGVTLGLKEILASKKIVLLVTGDSKVNITRQLIESPLTPQLPASFLKLHGNVEMHVDSAIGKYI